MTDVELETRNFLHELDTFGQPPPPQRIISDADSRTISKDFELKLHHINLDKQRRVRNATPNPKQGISVGSSSSIGTHSTNENLYVPAKNGAINEIKGEINKLKQQIVSASRPLNPWYEQQHQTPTVSSNFARTKAQRQLDAAVAERISPSGSDRKNSLQYLPISVATVSGENTVFSVANAKKSNCGENAPSISPASASSNTETSHSSISTTGSSTANSLDPNNDTFRAMPCAANGFYTQIPPTKTYYHSGPPIRRRPHDSVHHNNGQSVVTNGNSANKTMNHIQMNENQQPAIAPAPSSDSNRYQAKSNNATLILPWRKQSIDSVTSNDSGVSIQRKKYEEITSNLEKQLNLSRKPIGTCGLCGKPIVEESDATCALGQLYHQSCFTCDMCGRSLRGKKFYKTREKTYCEEDYLYSGMHETAERCAVCSHLIVDMVLQALGKSYHPRCFRCEKCKTCLDGVPFALDSQGHVYCIEDYHRLFAPKCAACRQPIMPNNESGETVRVVAINRDYHIECYVCEGCGTQLTDEPEKRCYPLNDHLLCKNCHIHWARTGGDTKPITDL